MMKDIISKFDTPLELWNYMKENIEYGFVDGEGNVHLNKVPLPSDDYTVRDAEVTLEKRCGLCSDQCEVEKAFFDEKNIDYKEYIVGALKNRKMFFHIFIIYEKENKYIWFERSYGDKFNQLTEFNSLRDAFLKVRDAFFEKENIKEDEKKALVIAECTDFMHPNIDNDDWNKMANSIKNLAAIYELI